MNARCYGGEISQVVSKVTTAVLTVKSSTTIKMIKCFVVIKTPYLWTMAILSEAVIDLEPGNKTSIEEKMLFCETDRNSKSNSLILHLVAFKNDYSVGVPSGMLLDKAGVHKLSNDRVQSIQSMQILCLI